jgi:hypothetical protein
MELLSAEELSQLERTYLGVLAMGLVPEELARAPRFRMECVCAVSHALLQDLPADTFLVAAHTATPAFVSDLRDAIVDLDKKGIVGTGPPQEVVLLTATPEFLQRGYGSLDINKHPPIFDRFLSQRCMDLLFAHPAVHSFLLELYAESSDIWGDLYKEGYGQFR